MELNLSLIPAIPSGITSIPNCSEGVDLRDVKFLLKFVQLLEYMLLTFIHSKWQERKFSFVMMEELILFKASTQNSKELLVCLFYLCNRNLSCMNTEMLRQGGRGGWAGH